jgi:hypothetical protein
MKPLSFFGSCLSWGHPKMVALRSLCARSGFVLLLLAFFAHCASFPLADEESTTGTANAAERAAVGETLAVGSRPNIRQIKKFVIDEIVSNHSLVRAELRARGWVEPLIKKRRGALLSSAQFLWTWSSERTKAAPADQIVNHFPHFDEIGTKIGLWKNLYALHESQERCEPASAAHQDAARVGADVHTFFPRCYLLVRDPELERQSELAVDPLTAERDKRRFVADFLRAAAPTDSRAQFAAVACAGPECAEVDEFRPWPRQASIEGTKNIWIVKPSRAARGVGTWHATHSSSCFSSALVFVDGSH